MPGLGGCWVRGLGVLGARARGALDARARRLLGVRIRGCCVRGTGWGGRPARFGGSSLEPELGGAGDDDRDGWSCRSLRRGPAAEGSSAGLWSLPGGLQCPSGRAVPPEPDTAPPEEQQWGRGVRPGAMLGAMQPGVGAGVNSVQSVIRDQ